MTDTIALAGGIAALFLAATIILYGVGLAIEAYRSRAYRRQQLGERWSDFERKEFRRDR